MGAVGLIGARGGLRLVAPRGGTRLSAAGTDHLSRVVRSPSESKYGWASTRRSSIHGFELCSRLKLGALPQRPRVILVMQVRSVSFDFGAIPVLHM